MVNKFKSSLFKEKRLAIPYFEEKKKKTPLQPVSRKKDTAEFVDPIKWQLASIKSRFYTHTHTHTIKSS